MKSAIATSQSYDMFEVTHAGSKVYIHFSGPLSDATVAMDKEDAADLATNLEQAIQDLDIGGNNG